MKKKILDSINQLKGFIKNKSFSESMESNLNDKETLETLEQETVTAETPTDAPQAATQNGSNNENADANTPENATHKNFEMAILQNEIAELKDRNMRLLAEFDNLRKRTAREKLEMQVTASRDIMTVLIPILDDFDRAAKNEQFTEGVNLVYQKMHTTLHSKGLTAMNTENGSPFDADTHEAIAELPLGDDLKGKIIDTVEKGYLLHDKIIRFAKVVVGK